MLYLATMRGTCADGTTVLSFSDAVAFDGAKFSLAAWVANVDFRTNQAPGGTAGFTVNSLFIC